MNNYMLSVDPSIKETGFILWEKVGKQSKIDCSPYRLENTASEHPVLDLWQPIWANTYNFKKGLSGNGIVFDDLTFSINNKMQLFNNPSNFNGIELFIERGFHMQNRNTTEMLDCLRGNIFGLFNKLYEPKKHGISPKKWQNWYIHKEKGIETPKWTKDSSLSLAKIMIGEFKWNIDIKNNHNLADALLIGWYAINNRLEQ